MKKYRVIYIPDDSDKDFSKDGFNSKEEAKKYILQNFCDACKKYWGNPDEASCMAEFDIEEYEEKK